MEWNEPISPQSLVDQINDEGEAFGLCAVVDEEMGAVFACEVEPAPEAYFGLADCSREGPGRRLATVDDEHPLSAVFGNRIQAGEVNPLERYHRHDEQLAKKKALASEAHAHDFRSTMARSMRGGAIFYDGMLADGATNRKARRIREALRKRGR